MAVTTSTSTFEVANTDTVAHRAPDLVCNINIFLPCILASKCKRKSKRMSP